MLVAGPDRIATMSNHTYLRRELIVSSLCGCIDTETYCSTPGAIIHARTDFHAGDYRQRFPYLDTITHILDEPEYNALCNMILRYSNRQRVR